MRLKELSEDFLEGEMVEHLKCEHCGHQQQRIRNPHNVKIEDIHCDKCRMHTDRGD